ncbi:MAG: ABC transporter permease [Succiniclasticum sp.]|nr:ABC transporter permease [Succiniclasticum sp.]
MNSSLIRFLAKNFIKMMTLVVMVSIVSFILLANSPIDPLDAYFANANASVEQQTAVAEYWGFNKPPTERLLHWASRIIRGDLGTSFVYREPVINVISEKFEASLALMMVAWALSGIFGFVLGVLAGVYRNSWIDKCVRYFSLVCVSTPLFWLGLLFLMIFAVKLQWFPLALGAPIGKLADEVTLAERIHHLILPALTLSITGISSIALQTRQKMIEVSESNYMLFAAARGETLWQRVRGHGLRNILLPAITLQFASFNELFGGAILAETVFSYSGLGGTVTLAGLRGDLSLLLGIAIFSAIFIFVGNLIAEVLYGVIDPAIREGGASHG